MATFTITTTQAYDTIAGKTGSDVFNINGGELIIRTDTRWNANSTLLTGTIANTTISSTLGGKVIVDSSKVREVTYTGGAGTVPAIGTSITQGGVTGELLGVWGTLNTAPITVGGAMPATGWIKFREVTGGSFTAGALTGITATASGPDVTSWIEIIGQNVATHTIPALGEWNINNGVPIYYDLGTTTGAPGQVIVMPSTNTAGTRYSTGVEIETAPGSNVFEFYPGINSSTGWATNSMGTLAHCKFVQQFSDGRLRIGSDGTNNIGFTPVAGCKIRTPNVFMQSSLAASRGDNIIPNTTTADRPEFLTTSGGNIKIGGVSSMWYRNIQNAFDVYIRTLYTDQQIIIQNIQKNLDVEDVALSNSHSVNAVTILIAQITINCNIKRIKGYRHHHASGSVTVSLSGNFFPTLTTIEDLRGGYLFNPATRASSAISAISVGASSNIKIKDAYAVGGRFFIENGGGNVENFDYIDRFVGPTNAILASSPSAFTVSNGINCSLENLTFGLKGTLSGSFNCLSAIVTTGTTSGFTWTNSGTYADPLNCGTTAFAPSQVFNDSGNSTGIVIKRIAVTAIRGLTSPIAGGSSTGGLLCENVYILSNSAPNNSVAGSNVLTKGIISTLPSGSASTGMTGSHWTDSFVATLLTGGIFLAFNAPNASTQSQWNITQGPTSGFTGANEFAFNSATDVVEATMPYFAIGHTGFQNVAPTLTGTNTGNLLIEYRLDTGTGFSGAWKTANGANLSAETISPTTGFRLQIRVSVATFISPLSIRFIRVNTTTDATNALLQYPLVTANRTLTITGMQSGSEVVLFNSSNVELSRQVVSGDFTYNYTWDSDTGDITGCYFLVWKDDKFPIKQTGVTLANANQTIRVVQQDDLLYDAGFTSVSSLNGSTEIQQLNVQGNVSVIDIYSEWKSWLRTGSNTQFQFAYSQVGGNTIGSITSIPGYVFQVNGWKLRPFDADGITNITEGVIVGESGADPFINTVNPRTVRINFQQPVQAITVNVGGSALTPTESAQLANVNTKINTVDSNVKGIKPFAIIAATRKK